MYFNIFIVFFIVLAFVAYFYFKTRQFRSTLPIRKKWYQSKAGIALGAFIMLFGINQAYLFPSTITFVVVAIFIILGIALLIDNTKKMRHYGQFIQEEYELNKK